MKPTWEASLPVRRPPQEKVHRSARSTRRIRSGCCRKRVSVYRALPIGYGDLHGIGPLAGRPIDEAAVQVQDDAADARLGCGFMEDQSHTNRSGGNSACGDGVGRWLPFVARPSTTTARVARSADRSERGNPTRRKEVAEPLLQCIAGTSVGCGRMENVMGCSDRPVPGPSRIASHEAPASVLPPMRPATEHAVDESLPVQRGISAGGEVLVHRPSLGLLQGPGQVPGKQLPQPDGRSGPRGVCS